MVPLQDPDLGDLRHYETTFGQYDSTLLASNEGLISNLDVPLSQLHFMAHSDRDHKGDVPSAR